jgi:hypothetical protein
MHVYITIGGRGERLKTIYPGDKQNLYWGRLTFLEWIFKIFPEAETLGTKKTPSRKETLKTLLERGIKNDILIIDCDVIPHGIKLHETPSEDQIWVFNSKKLKYGSLILDESPYLYPDQIKLEDACENTPISNWKASGVYFIKDLEKTLEKMKDPNSIAKAIIGAKCIVEETFFRGGDLEDYYELIKKERPYDDYNL